MHQYLCNNRSTVCTSSYSSSNQNYPRRLIKNNFMERKVKNFIEFMFSAHHKYNSANYYELKKYPPHEIFVFAQNVVSYDIDK